jgi:hypothetical protein
VRAASLVLVGRTEVGVVTAPGTGEEVDTGRVRANKEPTNAATTRIATSSEIRMPVSDKVGFVLSD